MSLRNRKRRQNRAELKHAPATRLTRFNLVTPSRGLRKSLDFQGRELLQPTKSVTPGQVDRLRRLHIARSAIRPSVRVQDTINNNILQKSAVPDTITVDLPRQHPICVARRERREIIFARGGAGKSGQRPRKKDVIIRCE